MNRFLVTFTYLITLLCSLTLFIARANRDRQPEVITVDYKAAAASVVPWGEFRGKTIDFAAQDDRGLLWLDWCRGVLEKRFNRTSQEMDYYAALVAYLNDATIAKDLAALIEKDPRVRKNFAKR